MRAIGGTRRLRVVVATVLALSACGAAGSPAAAPNNGDNGDITSIVVTTSILGDVVTGLVGDDGAVEVLMPVGSDPHDFELSARQAVQLREADLVIANGLQLEEGMVDALEAAETDGANILAVAEMVDPIEFGSHGDHDEEPVEDHEADEQGHDSRDPHFWLDPVRMTEAVHVIADAISSLDTGVGAGAWERRAGALAADIESAHQGFVETLATIPEDERILVTNHDSFGYFAARYDFEVVGTVIPGGSSLGEASAGDLAELTETITATGVPAIFVETTSVPTLAESVATESGRDIAVVSLYSDSLGAPGSDGDTYLGMMESNVTMIARALGDR